MLSKENNEKNNDVRPVLKWYTVAYLEKHMYLSMGLGIVFYSLWTFGKSSYFVWTVPMVLVICMSYNLILKNRDGDPIGVLVSSKPLIVMILAYAMVMSLIIYCV